MLFPTKYNPQAYIEQIVEFAKEARINGLLAWKTSLTTKDLFLKNSLMLVVDSVEPEKVKNLLDTELEYLDDRHAQDRAFYDMDLPLHRFRNDRYAIGLINLLKHMDDPNAIGSSMAVPWSPLFMEPY